MSSTTTDATIRGIHHVTAIASDPQRNVDFYTGLLGLRLVKRTVNFDDPGTYHLYYGDSVGHPGTILTFFPWPRARRGSRGVGQVAVTSFTVPEGSLGFWQERLRSQSVPHGDPQKRFGEEVLTFLDPDGLELELVARAEETPAAPWLEGGISERHAIRGFDGVSLAERDVEGTFGLLRELGLELQGEAGNRYRFGFGGAGQRIDVLHEKDGGYGQIAAGSVHHVALRVPDAAAQIAWQERLAARGEGVTEVRDRQYFRSIYFREKGGVLFELATDPPGFTVDETVAELGSRLQLPPWFESHRAELEAVLPALSVPVMTAGGRS